MIKPKKTITAFGETKLITDWIKDVRCIAPFNSIIYNRLKKGWTPEKALTTPAKSKKLYHGFEETKSIIEWSLDERCEVTYQTLQNRLRCGLSLEQSLVQKEITDLEDKKFGELTVIKSLKENGKWECKCSCGNTTIQTGYTLINLHSISCGCKKKLPYEEASKNKLYKRYQAGAIKRNLEFDLSKDEFVELTSSNCFYCGDKPSKVDKSKYMNGHYIYNGIDRTNNTKGYTIENCVCCCWRCNKFKLNLNIDEFFSIIKTIYENKKLNQKFPPTDFQAFKNE